MLDTANRSRNIRVTEIFGQGVVEPVKIFLIFSLITVQNPVAVSRM